MKLAAYHGDLYAICHTCRHQHLIAKHESPNPQPWLDWLHKHKGHATECVTSADLAARRHDAREKWDALLRAKLAGVIDNVEAFTDELLASILPLGYKDNSNVKEAFAASAAYTCTLTGLATSATLIIGRETTWISNATNLYLDELVSGKITTGTTTTANTAIEVDAVGVLNDTPTYPDAFTGTDSGVTITAGDAAAIKASLCPMVALLQVSVTTSNITHTFGPTGIRSLFGDGLPTSHGLFTSHNTGTNLNATASNQALYHTPVFNTVI